MIVASHQPNFLPYMGFFHKVSRADVFVASDDVLFSKKGMHNWQYIMENGRKAKITLPAHSHHDSMLCEIGMSDPEKNVVKMCKRFLIAYHGAEHYTDGEDLCCFMHRMAIEGNGMMVDFNISLITFLMEKFRIRARLVRGSTMGLEGHKDDRIIGMCQKVGADTYLSGKGAAAYHEPDKYDKAGIKLIYSEYEPLDYGSEPNLSVVDYVFRCGYDAERAGFA